MMDRRQFFSGIGALGLTSLLVPEAFAYVPTERRFVLVVLRGGMDALAAIPPVGDPDYANMRDLLAFPDDHNELDLDPVFSLHPALGTMKQLYDRKQFAVVHAAATEYRSRSHFDAQDTLEAGGLIARRVGTGWVYRALQSRFENVRLGVSVGPNVPLAIRGQPPAANFAPTTLKSASSSFLDVVSDLWKADEKLGATMAIGLKSKDMADNALAEGEVKTGASASSFPDMAAVAGRLLAEPDGPRVAVLDMNGFDTHRMQGLTTGPLSRTLGLLGRGFGALQNGLGDAWKDTIMVAVSEFGRTVRPNGTHGTDHGTGGAVFLAGGKLIGGRVIADWPGLKEAQLFEGRDLRPTIDVRAVLKGVLRDHLGVQQQALDTIVFPGSQAVKPLDGLVAA